jgi:hypothetical protein
MTGERMRAVPLHYERPLAVQVLFAHLVPLIFGAVCGIALGASKPVYIALNILAAIGGFLAGLEHDGAADGASRGAAGGVLFGAGILIAFRLAENPAKVELPDPQVILVVVTAVAGTVLGAVGGGLRRAAERRAVRPRAGPARAAVAEPEPVEPERTEPERTEPERTEPERTEPERTEPDPPAAAGGAQHAGLLARTEAAERATSEAQEQARRLSEERHEVEGRAASAEPRAHDYQEHLARVRDELQQARAEAEREQAASAQRAQRSEQELARLREKLEQARAEADRRQAEREQRAQASEQELAQLRQELERAQAETERLRAKAKAMEQTKPAAEDL